MAAIENSSLDQVVIFLGQTGCGKSTATKFIRQDPSLQIVSDVQVLCLWKLFQKYALVL
jgi:putative ribosome biogenesis GTPase RsgA